MLELPPLPDIDGLVGPIATTNGDAHLSFEVLPRPLGDGVFSKPGVVVLQVQWYTFVPVVGSFIWSGHDERGYFAIIEPDTVDGVRMRYNRTKYSPKILFEEL